LQPKDPRALADLGVHLLRTGDESAARTALEASFKIDPYNVVTYNLLEMMDKLDKCVTIRDGDIVVRMDKEEAAVLQDYLVALAHVITLQMSNQRVPRWLTEGISVYEEKRARPEWARPMDLEFSVLLERGETLKLRDLNAAFTDPRKISLAYYQASLLVEHLVTAYGEAGLRDLVRSYALGVDTEAALKRALNTDFDQLQTGFDQSMDRQFGGLRRAIA